MLRRSISLLTALAVGAAIVVGGAAAPASAATERIAGADRYSTSAAISRFDPTSSSTVFLASGQLYSDALAAAPVAAAEGGRLLLTQPTTIPSSVVDEIRRLAPRRIVIVGGTATIDPSVEQQARTLAPSVERVAGADRVAVSLALFDRQRAAASVSHLWVVSGGGFADALSAASVAARYGHGVVLTQGLVGDFEQQLRSRLSGVTRITIAGGTASVGADVEQMLRETGRTVERIGGADRYAVSVGINARHTQSATGQRMLLASGEVFTDGLAGAVLAGSLGVPMYLTPASCAPNGDVRREVTRLGIRTTTVLGGPSTVSDAAAALMPCSSFSAAISEMRDRLAAERAAAGLPPLRVDACLTAMADGWAQRMTEQQLSGSAHNPSLDDEARACGFAGWAENVGRTWGSEPDPQRMADTWMASSAHRTNILRASTTDVGIAMRQGSGGYWYWVLDFGRR